MAKTKKQKSHGKQIKDDRQYEALRDRGMSKNKAARIANTGRTEAGKRGGSSPRGLEPRSTTRPSGIEGRSSMSKRDLIHALRNH